MSVSLFIILLSVIWSLTNSVRVSRESRSWEDDEDYYNYDSSEESIERDKVKAKRVIVLEDSSEQRRKVRKISKTSTSSKPVVCQKSYYVDKSDKVSWFKAKEQCHIKGRKLVSIHDAQEWKRVLEAIRKADDSRGYWTSGSDEVHEGQWVWTETGRPYTFTNWEGGEPNNRASPNANAGPENCMQIYEKELDHRWNDRDCDIKINFICEKEEFY